VRITPTQDVIQRESSSRRIDVTADVSGRGAGDVRHDIESRIAQLKFPLEYHAEVLGVGDLQVVLVLHPEHPRDRRRVGLPEADLPRFSHRQHGKSLLQAGGPTWAMLAVAAGSHI